LIKVGDYICANCRQYSKKFKTDSAGSINTFASQLYPTLPNIDEEPTISPSTTYTLTTTASTSYNTRASTSALNTPSTSYNTKASSGTSSMEIADDEINHVTLKIPRTIKSSKNCIICNKSKNLINVPREAFINTFITHNILISPDNKCCKSHLNRKISLRQNS
jgi:hypothetical protein